MPQAQRLDFGHGLQPDQDLDGVPKSIKLAQQVPADEACAACQHVCHQLNVSV